MEKERILDLLFWLGFFTTLILVFINSMLFLIGIALVLITLIINFSAKNFLLRDIYVLGYFIGAIFAVASLKQLNFTALIIGLLLMLFSIVIHKYSTHRFEKKLNITKIKLPKKIIIAEKKVKKEIGVKTKNKLHQLTIIWSILSIVALIIAVILKNLYLFYLGILVAVLAIIINIADIKNRHIKNLQVKKEPEKKEQRTSEDERISNMKKLIVFKQDKYETDIDKLYRIVDKYKIVKLSEVKKVFNITNEKAEEWAKILETHDLIKIHYPPFGEAELKWKQ